MKFLHLSDLHIGKRVNGFSMLDDQKYILNEILKITETEKPDVVLIAGDVYDKPIPSADAVGVYDSFLTNLAAYGTTVCIISGNHDSAERIACCGRLMERNRVFVSPVYNGQVDPVVVTDGKQEVKIWLLPFVKPVNVRAHLTEGNAEINTYTEAMEQVISHLSLNPEEINVAVVHQFISGGAVCESEEGSSVGGIDQIASDIFAPFDYVALGHLHGPQKISRETIRYAGSPLKYSFSELNQRKSVTIVEVASKDTIEIRTIPLIPRRELVEIRGSFAEVTSAEYLRKYSQEDYYHIILTDEQDVPNAASRLRSFYPYWMVLDYDNTRTRASQEISGPIDVQNRSAMDLFTELFQKQMNRELNDFQQSFLQKLIEELQEEETR